MTRNTLYEESAISIDAESEKRTARAFNIAGAVSLALAGILFVSSLGYIVALFSAYQGSDLLINLLLFLLPLALLIATYFVFRHFAHKKNISYDYTFVSDELRITKVFNGKQRKHLFVLTAEQIVKVGYADKSSVERARAGLKDKDAVYLTPNREPSKGKMFIYVLCTASNTKELYVLECRQQLLECIVAATGINKFERQ